MAHPVEVSQHPTLHKRMFLVADKLDYTQSGLTLLELDWNGATDGKSEEELREIGRTASIDSISVGRTCWRSWRLGSGVRVLVLQRKVAWRSGDRNMSWLIQSAIDPRWDRRGFGEDRVIYAGSIEETEKLDTFQVYRKLFQSHLQFCRRQIFATNLCRDYFVYCDIMKLKGEDEVMVIKVVMPDKDVLHGNESDLPDLERGQMEETIMCQTSDAHALITDIVKGKKEWRGVSVET